MPNEEKNKPETDASAKESHSIDNEKQTPPVSPDFEPDPTLTEQEDDGHTVANMNVEGFHWYRSEAHRKVSSETYTDAERRAMVKAGLLAYLPMLLAGLAAFSLVYWLLYFLLRAAI